MRKSSLIISRISGVYDHVNMRDSPDSPRVVLNKFKRLYPYLSPTTWDAIETFLNDTFVLYSSSRVVPRYLRDNHDHSLARMSSAIEEDLGDA